MSVKKIQPLLFVFLTLLFLAGGIWVMKSRLQSNGVESIQPAVNRIIQVEVTGAVMQPGFYILNEDSRVLDALAVAGGLAPGADSRINLAEHLYDKQRLEIPYLNKTESPVPSETPSALLGDEPMKSLSLGVEEGRLTAVPSPTSTLGSDPCSKPVIGNGVFR